MSEQLKEALSAAVDGEASSFEMRRVFDEMSKDDELLRAWQSYHLVQQAVHKENVQAVEEMRERIWASLDSDEYLAQDIVQEEPEVSVEPVASSRRWGWVGGAAAAAVALAVVANFSGVLDDTIDSDQPRIAEVPQTQSAYDADVSPVDPNLQVVGRRSVESAAGADELGDDFGDDFDYGPGFVAYGDASAEDQARSDGYFMHHVQQRALNNENVLSFVKMISYPQ